MFENVNYTFYSDTLGRSTIPTEDDFNAIKLESILYVQNLLNDNLIIERGQNGIDSAICMMIEEEYKTNLVLTGKNAVDTSESIGGYSHSINTKAYDIQTEKDAMSLAEKKYKWLKLYCQLTQGTR